MEGKAKVVGPPAESPPSRKASWGVVSCAQPPARAPGGWFFLVTFFVHTKKVTRREAKQPRPKGRRGASPRRHPFVVFSFQLLVFSKSPSLARGWQPPPPPLPARHGRQMPTRSCVGFLNGCVEALGTSRSFASVLKGGECARRGRPCMVPPTAPGAKTTPSSALAGTLSRERAREIHTLVGRRKPPRPEGTP